MLFPPLQATWGRSKQPGLTRLMAKPPRGLLLTVPFDGPDFCAITMPSQHSSTIKAPTNAGVWPARRGSVVTYAPSRWGWGARFNGVATDSTNGLGWAATGAQTGSFEVLFVSGASVTSQVLFQMNSKVATGDGTGNNTDLFFDSSSHMAMRWSDTGPTNRSISDTNTYATNTLYHVVGTLDGTTARLYVDGAQVASGANGALNTTVAITNFFACIGAATIGAGSTATTSNVTMLLMNIASEAWSPGEVLERALDPFGFLAYDGVPQLNDMFTGVQNFIIPGKPTPASTTGLVGGVPSEVFYSWRSNMGASP